MEVWQRIRHLAAVGWSRRRIARELHLSRNTVAGALAAEQPPQYRRQPGVSPWAPWEPLLQSALQRRLCGSRVLEELQQAGYSGSRSAFYERWALLQAAHAEPSAGCRFETGPGEQAQFDWAEYTISLNGRAVRVYIYSLLLGFSRRVHWFPGLAVNQEAVFEGLEVGFQHFGGVCRFLVVDNARVFVRRHQGSEVEWNPNFLRLMGHYRVQPIAATPRHPQGKGKVENPFRHLEQRFLVGSEWRDWEHFQNEMAAFEARWEQRVHGTTKEVPRERFTVEQPLLLPLPATPYFGCHEQFRQVNREGLLSYGGVYYSVPWPHAGRQVLVRESQGRELRVYGVGGAELVRHELRPSGSPPVIVQAHYDGLRRRSQAALVGLAREFRERYGASAVAEQFLQRLLAQHRHRPDRPLSQALELLAAAPAAVAQAALAHAVEYNLCTPRFLEESLRRRWQGAGAAPPPSPAGQLPLPCLEVERSLLGYDQALAPQPGEDGLEGASNP